MIKNLFLFLFLPIFSFAQITTSELNGKIKETTGQVVPHSTLELTYVPTGTKYRSSANDKGLYHFYNANVGGPYILKVSSVGYKSYQKGDLYLNLGQNNDLDVVLEPEVSQLNEVVLKGAKTLKNTSGMIISEDRLKSVPTLSRSITDFTKLVPQSVNNSFAGTNFRYNNVTIDGTINNDAIGFSPSLGGQAGTSGMPGSSTRTSPISIDAIKDIQVYVAPFDVKIGNFLGGSINAITRSGTNKVEGSVYSFGRNASLAGFKTTKDFKDFQGGFRVGFPIVKDKLFFFTNSEITSRVDPLFYGANNGGLINDSIAKVISNFVKTTYNYNVGDYDDYTINSSSKKFFNRLDWNISDKHQLTVRNNIIFSNATNLERDIANFRFSSMDFKQTNNQNSTVLELRSKFGQLSNSLILGYTNIHDYRNPLSERSSFPQTEIAYNGGTIFIGNEREATVFNLKQKTFEFTDNVNFRKGAHSFTLGTHNEFYKIDYGFVNSWNGRVSYKSLSDFLAGKVNRSRGFYSFNDNTRDYLFNNPYAQFDVNLLSGYLQDEISLGKLKVSTGIRLDYTDLPKKPEINSQVKISFPNYTNDYLNNLNISPRIGFNYDVKGDKSLIIRGGSGVFVGRIPFAWLGYAFYNDGIGFGSYDLNNRSSLTNVGDPIRDGAKTFAFNNGQKNLVQTDLVDNGFKMPKMWRSNLAIDKTINGYKLTVEGIYTEVLRDLKFKQININTSSPIYFSYDSLKQMPIYNGSKINSNLSNAYLLSNTDKGYRYQLTTSVSKKYKFGLDIYGAYTYGVAKDLTNGIRNSMESNWQLNQSLTPNDPQLAYSNFDVRHRIISQVTYKIKKTQISFLLNSQSGIPFTWGLINSTLGNNPQAAGLVYIFKDLSQAQNYIKATGEAQAFIDFVNSNDYLSSRKGNFTERNGGRTPWSTTLDAKITQSIKVGKKQLQITADIFNLTNMLNNNWGDMYFISNTFNSTSSVGLTRTNSGTADPLFTFKKPTTKPYSVDNLNSKWQIQLGLRYNF
jgi:hypothetical protein